MTKIKQKMTFKKSTKNTHVYEVVDNDDSALSTIYINKTQLVKAPESIEVVINCGN